VSRPRRRRSLAVSGLIVVVAACAPTPPPRTPPPPPAPPAETGLERRPIPPAGVHVVSANETLSEIAYVYRLDTHALARANGIADPDRIAEGRRLMLRWTRAATAPAEAAEPDGGARAEVAPDGLPLRVVVTPRDDVEAEPTATAAAPTPSAGADTTTVEAAPRAGAGVDTAAVEPPPAVRQGATGARGAAPEE